MGIEDNKQLQADQLLYLLNIGADEDSTPTDLPSDILPSFKDYEIIEKIGEAGQGQVWRAIHLSTHREVALKIPKFHGFSPRQAFQRFEREVKVISRLDHPNIVNIYDSGIHKGIYFYTMDFIKGRHLDDYCKEENLGKNEIIELLRQICEVIEFAHKNDVIHRDLKPSNILITDNGEPHILDFGLAKLTSENDYDLTITMEKTLMGTPAFMSPEQAKGNFDTVDNRTDIYSLGIILFNLITNELPFDISGTREDVIKRVSENNTRQIKKIDGIDSELAKILDHIFQLAPEDRYKDIIEFKKDLENYLSSRPLLAGSASLWYKYSKYIKKYKAAASATVLLIISICLYTSLSGYLDKLRFSESFSYKQGAKLANIAGWELQCTTTPPLEHIITNNQLKENNYSGRSIIIPDVIIHTNMKLNLQQNESFEAKIDFTFDGNWNETIGVVLGFKDKYNYYSIELESIKNKPDRLLLIQVKDNIVKEIEAVKLELNKAQAFQIQISYDYYKPYIQAAIHNISEGKIEAELNSLKIEDLYYGYFGILTLDASHTYLDNFEIEIYPEPVKLHKFISALIPD